MHSLNTFNRRQLAGDLAEEYVQTLEKMSEVPFSVDVESESREELLRRIAREKRKEELKERSS